MSLLEKALIHLKESESLIDERNSDLYSWSDINNALLKVGMTSSRIADVSTHLRGKAKNSDLYAWSDINNALLKVGMTSSRIADVSTHLK